MTAWWWTYVEERCRGQSRSSIPQIAYSDSENRETFSHDTPRLDRHSVRTTSDGKTDASSIYRHVCWCILLNMYSVILDYFWCSSTLLVYAVFRFKNPWLLNKRVLIFYVYFSFFFSYSLRGAKCLYLFSEFFNQFFTNMSQKIF